MWLHKIIHPKNAAKIYQLFHANNNGRERKIHTDVTQALHFLKDEGVSASHVTMVHEQTNQTEILNIQSGTYSAIQDCNTHTDDPNLVLYVKDSFGLSNVIYHELSMVCDKLSLSWKLKQLAKSINSRSEIKPMSK